MTDQWRKYHGRFDEKLIAYVFEQVTQAKTKVLDPRRIPNALGHQVNVAEVIEFLCALSEDHVIRPDKVSRCNNCQVVLDTDAITQNQCFDCEMDFNESGDPIKDDAFFVDGEISRDIRWMIVIHGFNTRGPWQETLSWQIANKLKYSAPVLIHKYGFERLGILYRSRHRYLTNELGAKIRTAIEQAKQSGIEDPPDVIVHSFGSLLFSKVLAEQAFDDLKFGRIICAGSVIDPNFNWSSLKKTKRIDAVLCHCGAKDYAVPMAQHVIPDSGPAATKGFSDPVAKNIMCSDFAHSTALESDNITKQLTDQGVWHSFLTAPDANFSHPSEIKNIPWKRCHIFFRFFIRPIILTIGTFTWIVGGWRLASFVSYSLSKFKKLK